LKSISNHKILFAGTIVLAIFVGCLAYAYFVEPFRLVVHREEIRVQSWDQAFNGFRSVLISDIHGGSRGGDVESIERIVDLANAQDADAIFLLGDYVSQQSAAGHPIDGRPVKMAMPDVANVLGGLRARYGVFAVLGNHDNWLGGEIVRRELERVGIKVLIDDVATIDQNNSRLRILGLRDHLQIGAWVKFSSETRDVVAPTEGTGNIIVLEHSPDVLEMITGDLAISTETKILFAGHTHGGQVWLPVIGYPIVPSSYGQKYAGGHIFDHGLDLFVTTGTGTSILPFRFLVPPEIAVVTIRSK
jgi:predicted MPP superfamily phosphohydrolase